MALPPDDGLTRPNGPETQAERSVTPLTESSGTDWRKIAGGVGLFGLAALMLWFTYSGSRPVVAPARVEGGNTTPLQLAPRDVPVVAAPPPTPTQQQLAAAAPAPPPGPRPLSDAEKLYLASLRAPLMASSGASGAGLGGSGAPGITRSDMLPPDQDPLALKLRASRFEASRAARLPDRDFLLTQGSHIPCTLQTAMDSTQPGMTVCVVPNDILSASGHVVLLDKGTKVVGTYTGELRQGQGRIFVLWTRAETPSGVVIDLSSPGTDALGRSGFDGQVETHFWARFGAAILLSIVEDAGSAASSALQSGSGNNYGGNTLQTPGNAAGTALQGTANIQPTLRKNQGEDVAIMVARDLDFRGVYNVTAVR